MIVGTGRRADGLPAAGAGLGVRRLERRMIAWLVAAVLIVLALIRYVWLDVRYFP